MSNSISKKTETFHFDFFLTNLFNRLKSKNKPQLSRFICIYGQWIYNKWRKGNFIRITRVNKINCCQFIVFHKHTTWGSTNGIT